MDEGFERAIRSELRSWSDLVTDDVAVDERPFTDHWAALARRTGRYAPPSYLPRLRADHADNPPWKTISIPFEIAQDWKAYGAFFEAFLVRNPRVAIACLMMEGADADAAGWFPEGREAQIRDWAREGFPGDPPDRRPMASSHEARWRRTMSAAVARAGDGWVYSMPHYGNVIEGGYVFDYRPDGGRLRWLTDAEHQADVDDRRARAARIRKARGLT